MKNIFFLIFFGLVMIANAQSVEIKDLMINGNISCYISLDELKTKGVKIDSIISLPEIMDMSEADSLIYVGRTYFEYDKASNTCHLSVVKFDNKVSEVVIGDLTLSSQTTIDIIQQRFPEYCQTIDETQIYQDPNTYKTCATPIYFKGEMTDSALVFFFLNDKLTRIDIN